MLSNSAQARWGLAAAAIVVSVVAGGIILGNNGNQQGIIAARDPQSDRRAHADAHAHAVCPRPPRCANDALPGPYHRDLHRARDVQAVVVAPLAHHDQLRRARGLVGVVPRQRPRGLRGRLRRQLGHGWIGLGRHVHDRRRGLAKPVRSECPEVRTEQMSIRPRSSRRRWRRGRGSRRRPPCRSRSTAPRGSWLRSPRRKRSSSALMVRPSCGRPKPGPSSIPTRWSMRTASCVPPNSGSWMSMGT